MDIADRSFHAEQAHIDNLTKLARQPTASRYKPLGYCLGCYTDLKSTDQLFCNNLCADSHDRLSKLGLIPY